MDNEVLNNIKNFTLNMNINNYHNFVNYFYKLNNAEKENIIKVCIEYKKNNDYNIKNGNLNKIYDMYKILLHKLEYNELNFKEKEIYEFIKRTEISIGEFENDNLFEKYCNKYLKNGNLKNYNNNNIFLIMQDMLNELNKKYNNDSHLIITDEYEIAYTNWLNKETRGKIVIGEKYIERINIWSKTYEKIEYVIAYSLFLVLHEYKHLLQTYDFIINNSIHNTIYFKEEFMICRVNSLYQKFHDNFVTEKEANEFAYHNIFDYLSKYVKYEKEDIKKYLKGKFGIFPLNSKEFLLKYKTIIKYIDLDNKIRIKKVNNFYNEIHKLKKEYKETYFKK